MDHAFRLDLQLLKRLVVNRRFILGCGTLCPTVVSAPANIADIGLDGEDRGPQLNRFHLHPAASFRFWMQALPKGQDFVHHLLIERAAVEAGWRWIHSERVFKPNAAFDVAFLM